MSSISREFKEIQLEKIHVGDFLKEYDSRPNVRSERDARKGLDSLKESIQRVGLIHPILVMPINDEYELIAGQRRLYAYQDLGEPKIPATIIPRKDILDAKIISAHESLVRRGLSFSDRRELALYLYDKFDGDIDDIARSLSISKTSTSRLLADRLIPGEVAELVDSKRLTRAFVRNLISLLWPHEELIIDIARRAVDLADIEKDGVLDLLDEMSRRSARPPSSTEVIDRGRIRRRLELRIILTGGLIDELSEAAQEYDLDPAKMAKVMILEWLDARRG